MQDFEPKDGVIAVPPPKNAPHYNFAKLLEYCRERGIKPIELTDEERKMFIIPSKGG